MNDKSISTKSRTDWDHQNLLFNANLQEFAQKVGYISSLESAGKLSPEDSYKRIKMLWQDLKNSKKNLIIGENPFEKDRIHSLIQNIYENGYAKRFNPRIYIKLGIEVDEKQWIKTISKLVQLTYLTEELELTCPSCHEVINSYIKYQNIPLNQTIRCTCCNHEFEILEEHIVPMYSFSDSFDPIQYLNISENQSDALAKKD
jgi:DNA-directed RNA polymerase subunit M/transcription elongation factor TFIIS